MHKARLYEAAGNFRRALLACPKDAFSEYQRRQLRNFPMQSCDVASLLLAYYLRDLGFTDIERICGLRNGETHVWLESGGCIIDITADQFPEIGAPITVVEAKEQSWHSLFVVQSRVPAYALDKVRAAYDRAYSSIKNWIEFNSAN